MSQTRIADSKNPPISSYIQYDSKLATEVMPEFHQYLPEIILGYLDLKPIVSSEIKNSGSIAQNALTLFGKRSDEFVPAEASEVGNLILSGEEKDLNKAIELVTKTPNLLRENTLSIDYLGRRVRGTPLQIAAKAGDLNLKENIREEKERGALERLIAAGNLSQDEIIVQLHCMTSPEAKRINAQRNQQVLDAFIKFGQGLIDSKHESNIFKTCQTLHQDLILQFEKDLESIGKQDVTHGYIFDPKVISDALQWIADKQVRLGNYIWSQKAAVLWINGIGKLQSKLSARDAHVITAGIGNLLDHGIVPARNLVHSDGNSYFYHTASCLGKEKYLGYLGARPFVSPVCMSLLKPRMEKYSQIKNANITQLLEPPVIQRDVRY